MCFGLPRRFAPRNDDRTIVRQPLCLSQRRQNDCPTTAMLLAMTMNDRSVIAVLFAMTRQINTDAKRNDEARNSLESLLQRSEDPPSL